MGHVYVEDVRLEHPAKMGNNGSVPIESTLVDTSSLHSMFPESVLRGIDITPIRNVIWELADGSQVEYPVGLVNIFIGDVSWPCPVIFGPDGQYLLGATTLETFCLMVDPEGGQLIQKRPRARPF